jgi:hypothetical protein
VGSDIIMTFIDLTKNQIFSSQDPKVCFYCKKHLRYGDIITLNETEDIVHLKCAEEAERKVMADRLETMSKEELIDKLRWVLKNEDNYNDWAILDRIKKIVGKKEKYKGEV